MFLKFEGLCFGLTAQLIRKGLRILGENLDRLIQNFLSRKGAIGLELEHEVLIIGLYGNCAPAVLHACMAEDTVDRTNSYELSSCFLEDLLGTALDD